MKRKVVVLCGSMRFLKQMQETAERLELENGWACVRPSGTEPKLIVNVDGYVGESVRREIEYAQMRGKEILWLETP